MRRLIARVLRRAYLTIWRARYRGEPVWSGVYPHLRDVPSSGSGFGGSIWLEGTRKDTERALRSLIDDGGPSIAPSEDHALLPLLAGTVAAGKGAIRILDFGGGMGIGYVHVRAALDPGVRVHYTILETSEVARAGSRLFAGSDEVRFITAVPEALPDIDILYSRTALQYAEDYAGLLRGLLRQRPRFVLLVTLQAGDIPTFATAQRNLPGSVLPAWFFRFEDIATIFRDAGYELVMRESSSYPFGERLAVPPSHRLEHACNVLFARSDVG